MLKRIPLIVLLTIAFVAIAAAQPAALKNYYNQENKVGFKYPANWRLDPGKADDNGKRKTIVNLKPPAASLQGQLSEAIAGLSVRASDLEGCKTFKDEDLTYVVKREERKPYASSLSIEPRKVGNSTFYLMTHGESAAGVEGLTDYYHTFSDGRCYELYFRKLGHQAPQPDPYQKAMDQNFEAILGSLYFGEQSVAFQRYESYFVRNDWGLIDESPYLAITSQAQFDQIFGAAAMPGSIFLPDNAFNTKLVVATVVHGSFLRKYEVTKVTGEGRKLYVWYQFKDVPSGSATFASPLILAVDKSDYEQVIFMRDGKQAGQVSVATIGGQKQESPAQTPASNRYYNQEYKVGLEYPGNWKLTKLDDSKDDGKDDYLASLQPPDASLRGQLRNASVGLWIYLITDEAACMDFRDQGTNWQQEKPVAKKIGDLTLYQRTASDGAAGSAGIANYYRIFHGGHCYTLKFETFQVNTPQDDLYVKTVKQQFDAILRSFYFGK